MTTAAKARKAKVKPEMEEQLDSYLKHIRGDLDMDAADLCFGHTWEKLRKLGHRTPETAFRYDVCAGAETYFYAAARKKGRYIATTLYKNPEVALPEVE